MDVSILLKGVIAKNMSIQDEIINTVETVVKKYLGNLQISRDVPSVVTAISNNKYKVEFDGEVHWLKDGIGLNLTIGTQVWIRIVGKEMYIASKR